MKFWAISWYLTSYLTSKSRLSRQKVNLIEFWQLHCVPRVKICIYTPSQLYLIIFGILTHFEGNFEIFYDIWRHIWRQNHVLPLQKFLNIIIQTSLSVFHPKRTHLYAVWDQHGHFNEISVVLGYFGWFRSFWGSMTSLWGQDFKILNFWLHHRFSHPQKTYLCERID